MPSWFGLHQCDNLGTNPPFSTCTSIVSQEQSDFCASVCYPDSIYVNTKQSCSAPCGSTFTIPAGKFLGVSVASANVLSKSFACASVKGMCSFSNTAQSCTIACADSTTQTYTIPAGKFSGPSQAQVNSLAASLACEFAALQCFGSLFSNTPQSCEVICPATGGTASVTVPAGAVFGLSQESANARALEVACLLALISCDGLPPLIGNQVQSCSQVCLGETITQTVPAGAFVAATVEEANSIALVWCALTLAASCAEQTEPDVLNVGNGYVSCSISCSGGGTFTFHVAPNSFRLENLAAANAAAQSYCQSHVVSAQFCLGTLDTGGCVNSVYASALSGVPSPGFSGVTAGTLPPGLSYSGGMLSGILTTSGVYTFTITAANTSGNRASREYTIYVGEITPDTLPDAALGTPYAQALTGNGFTNPVWTIAGGALPSGLTIHPATGVISGTPDGAPGQSDFVVEATEGTLVCSKELSIIVTGDYLFWKMEAASGNRIDSIQSVALVPFTTGGGDTVTGPAGKILFGAQLNKTAGSLSPFVGLLTALAPQFAFVAGGSFTIAGWVRRVSGTTANPENYLQLDLYDDAVGSNLLASVIFDELLGTAQFNVQDLVGFGISNRNIATGHPVGTFFFFALVYNGATGLVSGQIDGGGLQLGAGVANISTSPYGTLLLQNAGPAANNANQWDEVGWWGEALSQADITYLYNAGVGRTSPIVLP